VRHALELGCSEPPDGFREGQVNQVASIGDDAEFVVVEVSMAKGSSNGKDGPFAVAQARRGRPSEFDIKVSTRQRAKVYGLRAWSS